MNKIFYFTSTGNSLFAAKEIQKKIGGELISITKALKEEKLDYKGEKVGFIYPCYSWQTPTIVREFIDRVKVDADYVFSVMTYGFIANAAVDEFDRFCSRNKIKLDYSTKLLMVDNYLPGFDMDKQLEKVGEKKIEENLAGIIEGISNEEYIKSKASPINKICSRGIYKLAERYHNNMPNKFRVEDSCISCKICKKVCPMDNIEVVEGKPSFGSKCIACLGCTNNCPVNAIRLTNEKSKARFRNEHIKLEEIIKSND